MFRLLIIVLFLAFLIVFALSNTDLMPVWIASFGWKVPLGSSALGLATASLLLGLVLGWVGELGQRRRARRAENQVRFLEKQQNDLQQEIYKLKTQLHTFQMAEATSSTAVSSDVSCGEFS